MTIGKEVLCLLLYSNQALACNSLDVIVHNYVNDPVYATL